MVDVWYPILSSKHTLPLLFDEKQIATSLHIEVEYIQEKLLDTEKETPKTGMKVTHMIF